MDKQTKRIVLGLFSLYLTLAAVVGYVTFTWEAPTHNVHGGYIDACGDLPGMVGDDC